MSSLTFFMEQFEVYKIVLDPFPQSRIVNPASASENFETTDLFKTAS